jgi:hypothetical protein
MCNAVAACRRRGGRTSSLFESIGPMSSPRFKLGPGALSPLARARSAAGWSMNDLVAGRPAVGHSVQRLRAPWAMARRGASKLPAISVPCRGRRAACPPCRPAVD